mgnify:CR=1 FL=1
MEGEMGCCVFVIVGLGLAYAIRDQAYMPCKRNELLCAVAGASRHSLAGTARVRVRGRLTAYELR